MKKIITVIFLISIIRFSSAQTLIADTVIYGLDIPVAFVFFPNNNVIITQKAGLAKIYNLSNTFISNFWNFTDSTFSGGECGLLGVCLDPNYQSNHYIYFYYTHSPNFYRVVRLTENNNIGTNPAIIFHETGRNVNAHVGGNIRFGRDNKLYIIIGNDGSSISSQSLTTFKGKLLRINPNGTIPTDNPFYDDGNPHTGNDDRIWVYGLRNSFDFCVSPFNDSLYATENGDIAKDEVNFISKGKNYGYPVCSGYCNPYNPLYKNPMTVFDCCSPGSAALTGILIYNGSLMTEFYGKMIVAGSSSQQFGGGIFSCTLGNPPYNDSVSQRQLISTISNVIGIMQNPNGYIYGVRYSATAGAGKLLRFRINPNAVNGNSHPVDFSLLQNYPNPFNPTTSIKYEIPKSSFVTLRIYNVLGIEIAMLVNETKQQGSYEVNWDGSNYPSGVYFYELQAGEYKDRKKMVLIK